jgi:hypothetical protein
MMDCLIVLEGEWPEKSRQNAAGSGCQDRYWGSAPLWIADMIEQGEEEKGGQKRQG